MIRYLLRKLRAAGLLPKPAPIIAIRFSSGTVEIRKVCFVGEAARARAYQRLPDTEFRVLPLGAVKGAPNYVKGWEPVSPPDWQPDGFTTHERLASLQAESSSFMRKVHALEDENKWLRARLRDRNAALRSIGVLASDGKEESR